MAKSLNTPLAKTSMSIFGGILVTLALAGCTTAGEDRDADRRRCSEYRHYSGCMYMQQHHRDHERLMNQEKALINAQQARENLRMLREIRRRRGEY